MRTTRIEEEMRLYTQKTEGVTEYIRREMKRKIYTNMNRNGFKSATF